MISQQCFGESLRFLRSLLGVGHVTSSVCSSLDAIRHGATSSSYSLGHNKDDTAPNETAELPSGY